MERKIGEIFEYNGEWYQCIKGLNCLSCFFNGSEKCDKMICSLDERTDSTSVFFKKLEKWGKPYPNADKLYQLYILPMNIEKLPTHTEGINLVRFDIVEIEIKQNKEDMEEKKLNLKPFDIQKAKEGKPVCTRDGRNVRILCFDAKREKNIVALVPSKENPGFEDLITYPNNGNYYGGHENDVDLMMMPEKKEGWVNVYKKSIYKTKEDAFNRRDKENYLMTIKVGWDE